MTQRSTRGRHCKNFFANSFIAPLYSSSPLTHFLVAWYLRLTICIFASRPTAPTTRRIIFLGKMVKSRMMRGMEPLSASETAASTNIVLEAMLPGTWCGVKMSSTMEMAVTTRELTI